MLSDLKKHLTLNNIVLVVALLLALSWAWSTINVLSRNYDLERQVEQARLDTDIMKLQNENLRLEQVYYKTDEYLELSARKLLNKARPGEHLVMLPHTETTSTTPTAVPVVEKSNFEQWMDFLFGRRS
ncbi:septum formation initiator family protein [Candidatus Saccharibacteria bacterium]|nr:septum formation initiator family protein [Candidatus Saccharibacteria bacterium]